MIYKEREHGLITDARENSGSRVGNFVVDLRFFLGRHSLPGGFPISKAKGITEEFTPHQVIFTDFKASPQPEVFLPNCRSCQRSLRWKPGTYSFTEMPGITYTVPQMGMWKCSGGHPGQVDMQDYSRYVRAGEQFKQYLREIHGDEFQVKYGKIIHKG